jgi:predicted Rossmann-fold nucleotide-binding protein
MRKFWFNYLAKAMVVMPGGFGTFDEFMETVTLVQTLKIKKRLPIVLYGTSYWDRIIDFEPMVQYGMISPHELDLFFRTDSVDEAFEFLTRELRRYLKEGEGNGGAAASSNLTAEGGNSRPLTTGPTSLGGDLP